MAIKHFVLFTLSGEGLPVAWRVQQEGKLDVQVGIIESNKDILTKAELASYKPEDKEEKKQRMAMHDGMLNKMPAKELVAKLLKVSNPEEYFIYQDFNHNFKVSEQLMGHGFHGNFPTEEDRELEADRNKAKEFIKKHYPDILEIEVQEFKKADEGLKFLEETQDAWVLKGLDEDAKTVVPDTDDPEIAKMDLRDALSANPQMYEKSGYVLEKMIPNVMEITPEIQFYNGKVIATFVDIEQKRLGAGEQAMMTGCAADLVFPTDISDKINKMAFPKVVYDMAKKHEGWFVWDLSILFNSKTGEAYPGEFCSNRPGYNAFYTELALQDSVTDFFLNIAAGKNPISKPIGSFASSVRAFNIQNQKPGEPAEMADKKISWDEFTANDIWPYNVKAEDDDEYTTTGYSFDTAIVTGVGNDIQESAKNAYTGMDGLRFSGKYIRPLHDYLSRKYPNSILNRYLWGKNQGLY